MGEATLLELYDTDVGLCASKHLKLHQVAKQHPELQAEDPGQEVRPVYRLLLWEQCSHHLQKGSNSW